MDDIKLPFVMTVIGPKRAGKTTFIKTLLKKHLLKKFDYVVVTSETAELSGDFDFLEKQKKVKYFIATDGICEAVEELTNKVTDLVREKGRESAPNVLLIMDDCATHPALKAGSCIDRFAIRHRHSKLSLLIVGHSFKGICGLPKSLRSQLDYMVIFNPVSMLEIETILKEALFKEDFEQAKRRAIEVFSKRYNYLVYEPAAPYYSRISINFDTPLLQQ